MKSEYRNYFDNVRKFVKMVYFLKMNHIQSSRFTSFMTGNDYALSVEKLELLKKSIINEYDKIV